MLRQELLIFQGTFSILYMGFDEVDIDQSWES